MRTQGKPCRGTDAASVDARRRAEVGVGAACSHAAHDHCPLTREHLSALYQADRTVGLLFKYLLLVATPIAGIYLSPTVARSLMFWAALGLYSLGTIGLHVAYARTRGCERCLVAVCVTLECYYVVVAAWLFHAPLEVLVVFPVLKLTQLIESVRFHVRVTAGAAAVVCATLLVLNPHRFLEAQFGWEVLCIGFMAASSLLLSHRMRRAICPGCVVTHQQTILLDSVMRAQEDERKRIARELHDSRSQSLSALIINLDLLRAALPNDADTAVKHLDLVRQMANQSLDDTQRMVHELRPVLLDDLGLDAAVRWFVRHAVEPRGLAVELSMAGIEGRRYESGVEIAAFRILQEALANCVRHSDACTVQVRVTETARGLSGAVEDDGRGFRMDDSRGGPVVGSMIGLYGMRERAVLLGGTFAVASVPGQGTTVEFELPRVGGSRGN